MTKQSSVLGENDLTAILRHEYEQLSDAHLKQIFADNPGRFEEFLCECGDLYLDLSKHKWLSSTRKKLCQLAEAAGLTEAQEALFKGEPVNNTERRAAQHWALRTPSTLLSKALANTINQSQASMFSFADNINNEVYKGYTGKPITDIVNIGIGGSDLGPAMTVKALEAYKVNPHINFHFVSNIDPSDISTTLACCNPETTLFIVASKTFTTLETLSNATIAKQWFLNASAEPEAIKTHFVAISTNLDNVKAFGIAEDNIFPMWDWVGGRYSVWSSIGLPLCIAIGPAGFKSFLEGGYKIDQHFQTAPFESNAPVLLALLSIWYSEFFRIDSHGVLCYDHYLDKFPDYLQQLDMESNGKRVTKNGSPVECKTGIPIWGNVGSNSQHSFHQLLHQGTTTIPIDFIVGVQSCNPVNNLQEQLFANCLAQSKALLLGRSEEEIREEMLQAQTPLDEVDRLAPHKVIPGDKPSTTIIYQKLTPAILGQLIALYEHKVFVQSVIWDINPFDQWGVELGKKLSKGIYECLTTDRKPEMDCSTTGLINLYKSLSN